MNQTSKQELEKKLKEAKVDKDDRVVIDGVYIVDWLYNYAHQLASELVVEARIDELRNTQLPTNVVGIAIARQLENRINKLESQLKSHLPKKAEQFPCDDCGATDWEDWTLLPHSLFNKVCPNGAGILCLDCFAKRIVLPKKGGESE